MAGARGDDAAGAGLGMLAAGSGTAPALRGLSRFADARGVPAGREFLLDYDVIEAFCVAGLAGRAPATRGTYRSALYRLAEARHGPPGRRGSYKATLLGDEDDPKRDYVAPSVHFDSSHCAQTFVSWWYSPAILREQSVA